MNLRGPLLVALWAALCGCSAPATAGPDNARAAAQLERGAAALRAMDCARCHGRHYAGWAAPSLLAAVRDGPRERFDHFVLEGDVVLRACAEPPLSRCPR